MTKPQRKALQIASKRHFGNVCPVVGVHAAAETALLNSLRRKGYIDESHSPRITDAGRAAVAALASQ